jgi:hypothetical protein
MENGWTLIYTATQSFEAELMKQNFANNDIEAVILNKRDSTYNTFGELEVYVKDEDKEAALNLIKKFEN